MGCISSKTKAPDREPYGNTVTPPETTHRSAATEDAKLRSETTQVGYHAGEEAVQMSRDSALDVHRKTSSTERQRTAEQLTSSDGVDQPATSIAVSTRGRITLLARPSYLYVRLSVFVCHVHVLTSKQQKA